MNKEGQIAIWVILALVIAGGILIFVYVMNKPSLTMGETYDPQQYIEDCVQEVVNEAVEKMLPQGGFLEPKVFKVYNDTNVAYLCKRDSYYKPCVNLHPMLMNEVSNEIISHIKPRIKQCFNNMKKEAEKKGIEIEMTDYENISIGLAPGRINVKIEKEVSISEKEKKYTTNQFDFDVMSATYELVNAAILITGSEAKYCSFEYLGYMSIDRNLDISKWTMSDSTKIYTIRYKPSGELMNIAIKGCVLPLGL